MTSLYPFQFEPLFKERVWGGRHLETLFQKKLPPDVPIGESWEIADRDPDVSLVANGPLAGRSLRWIMENHAEELLGNGYSRQDRFPLLIKILDAREKLSLQVHPPASVARSLNGEPKTEMWYIAHATPEADLFAGLRQGVTREEFVARLKDGTVADCFHRLSVQSGDALFLPSGRVHAIGAGNVIFEIQQNSDTTYRVFDWNRVGLDGKPRELHIEQAMASIDFNDFEPLLIKSEYSRNAKVKTRYIVQDPLFMVNGFQVKKGERFYMSFLSAQIIGIVEGELRIDHGSHSLHLKAGQFCLLPKSLERVTLTAEKRVTYLLAEPGKKQVP